MSQRANFTGERSFLDLSKPIRIYRRTRYLTFSSHRTTFINLLSKNPNIFIHSKWFEDYKGWDLQNTLNYPNFNPMRVSTIKSLKIENEYCKVASSRLSWLVAHLRIFRLFMKGEIWCLCTVTFWQKGPKLNSSPVYCSRLYGMYILVLGR